MSTVTIVLPSERRGKLKGRDTRYESETVQEEESMEAIRVEQNVSTVVQKCKHILEKDYRDRFQGLVLYGSTAREQDDPSSDIDLLVLLGQPFDFFRELRHIVDLLYDIQLESDRLISAKPAAVETFDRGELQLYRNARHEGRFVA